MQMSVFPATWGRYHHNTQQQGRLTLACIAYVGPEKNTFKQEREPGLVSASNALSARSLNLTWAIKIIAPHQVD